MKKLFGAVSRFLRRHSGNVVAEVTPLPAEIRGYLAQRDNDSLMQWLQKIGRSNPEALQLPLLLAGARELGWSQRETEKLEVFVYYHRGDMRTTFERASRYVGEADFDHDMAITAILALYHLGEFDTAYEWLLRVRHRESEFVHRMDYAVVATLTCLAAGRVREAKPYADAAWRLANGNPVAALNAYAVFFELGDMESFAAVREQIVQGKISVDQAGFSLAIPELAQDHYQEGFRLLELRYQMFEAHRYLNCALFDRPRWKDENLQGKTLLVSAEQGLGDTVQMARYLPGLECIGASRIVMETQPETLTLLRHNFPGVEIVAREFGRTPPVAFDLWIGAMSLPHVLGATEENIPGRGGYLRVPPESATYWRERVSGLASGDRPRIGLAWSGSPVHRGDRRRSIPFSQMMDAIRGVNADFFALQVHVPEERPDSIIDVSEEMITLADTAALIAEMDLVITVDTSVVHLAGAIGKETWLLLPYRYEWRWGLEGEKNRWYDSVHLFRQKTHGDWSYPMEEVFRRRLPNTTFERRRRQ